MPRFVYTAFTQDGRRESGETEAATIAEAYAGLSALGLTVSTIEPQQAVRQGRLGVRSTRQVLLGAQAELAEQMAALFFAGLPALRIVEIIAQTTPDPVIRRHFERMARLMADGQSFADSLAKASGAQLPLSVLFVTLARTGQETGKIGTQYPQLAKALRASDKLTAQIRAALIYPMILVAAGIVLLGLMAIFLAPRLESVFLSVNRPTPPVIAAFTAIEGAWRSGVLPLALGVCVALCAVLWRSGVASTLGAGLMARAPGVGRVVQSGELATAIRSLAVMIHAGITLPDAFSRIADANRDPQLGLLFQHVAEALVAGDRAHIVLAGNRAIPPIMAELVRVGEETNTLSDMLETIAVTLELDVERKVQRLMALLTPMLTLVVGGGVAFLVVSIMGAILSINDLAF